MKMHLTALTLNSFSLAKQSFSSHTYHLGVMDFFFPERLYFWLWQDLGWGDHHSPTRECSDLGLGVSPRSPGLLSVHP